MGRPEVKATETLTLVPGDGSSRRVLEGRVSEDNGIRLAYPTVTGRPRWLYQPPLPVLNDVVIALERGEEVRYVVLADGETVEGSDGVTTLRAPVRLLTPGEFDNSG